MPWIDEHGEMSDECGACEQTRRDAEVQITSMEREMRSLRAARARAESQLEAHELTKRDTAEWKARLAHWMETFPDKRVTSKTTKSARATAYFKRTDAGAMPEDVDDAITAAKEWPYVVYGQRRQSGSRADLRVDLQEIVSVGNDAQFDFLVEKGREIREQRAKEELF